MVGAPQVVIRKDPDTGKDQQPFEEATIEVPSEYQGLVMEEFQKKGGNMTNMEQGMIEGSMIYKFEIPTSGLIGMQSLLMQKTRGTVTLNTNFSHWGDAPKEGLSLREKGAIVTTKGGKATSYSIEKMQSKGSLWVQPGTELYEGMCVGLGNTPQTMELNAAKEKAVTNVRAGGFGGPQSASAGTTMTMNLDDFLGVMDTDELLEVTPTHLRLVKRTSKALKAK